MQCHNLRVAATVSTIVFVFVIKTVGDGSNRKTLVVAGRVPAGVIFGTFDLIRRIKLG